MTTETPEKIIDQTARELGVPADTVASLFEFIDQLKQKHGEDWYPVLPGELMQRVRDGVPWATEMARSSIMASAEELFGAGAR